MRFSLLAGGLLAAAVALPAQQPTTAQPAPSQAAGPTLTLDDAIALARRNNPTYQSSVNERRRAAAAVRSAYGALAPQVSSNFYTQYRQGGQQLFAGTSIGASADQINAGGGIDVNAQFSAQNILTPRVQRANAEAVESDITASEQTLRSNVTAQYILALQQQARAALQDTLVATAAAQLELAKARVAVGAATILDARQAEVALGQLQVAAIQARNQAQVEKLRLFQQMGVQQPTDVQLTTRFEVTEPRYSLDALLDEARKGNPTLNALRTREHVADVTVKASKGAYLPTLALSAGLSGYGNTFTSTDGLVGQALLRKQNNCFSVAEIRQAVGQPADPDACNALSLSQSEVAAARAQNGRLFNFTKAPYNVTAQVSLPIFNGFQREQQVQQAIAARNDAEYRTRGQELQTTADVTAAYLTLQANRQSVALQEKNAATAREALALAQERYRVGANTFIEVSQARDVYARAQTDYVNAIYDFHRSFAQLEAAVGRPLR
ncbi:outer membrane efflux protein [Gemmatirosa kalamazoonensis]|uniref:Outer membrane efflux protein n=1 Tax=Gemmatirosa kalamazoonensis TaxID=861299 RepID=W0RI33_9BACT|nr:TolC family protein [Gemmatirosa kalamazoonensis]AHG90441.1 outer membrane efflux protein [Gemmatirosa kalamazoonensis]